MGRHPTTTATPIDLGIDGIGPATLVATGGSATVYRARQAAFERDVAVKVFADAGCDATRFADERRCLGLATANAGAVTVLDAGETIDGNPFLLFPWFDRGSLHELVRRQGPLPLEEALFLLQPVAETLADLHAAGIAHRDVKPGNVLLTDRFRPRLTDFGAAASIGATAPLAYTPGFAAPEASDPSSAVAATLDVHGFAATAWYLLTGETPAPRHPATVPLAAPDRLPIPPLVVDLLERCLSLDPAERPRDGSSLAAELRRATRLSRTETVAAVPPLQATGPPSDPAGLRSGLHSGLNARLRSAVGRWGWAALVGGGLLLAALGRFLG